ncbi:MAG: putative porin [Nitrospirae bacterium]|nr:putative porin [Nitrospirota bacterium]
MNKIRRYVCILSLCILWAFCSSTAYAQDNYQTEVLINYYSSKDDADNKTKTYGIKTTTHFSRVETTGHPLAEADFLERIGSITLFAGKWEQKLGSTAEADGPFYGLQAMFMKPDYPLVLQAQYIKTDLEFDQPLDGDITNNNYALKIGWFFSRGLLAFAGYSYNEARISLSGMPEITRKENNYAIGTKLVQELGDDSAFNLEASVEQSQFEEDNEDGSNTILGISGDYYFTNQISAGADFEINSGDDKYIEGKTIGINSRVFITHQISFRLDFQKFLADNNEGNDEDSYSATVLVRF